MNKEQLKFEISVIAVLFVFYEKIDPIIQSPFGIGAKHGGIFFSLTTRQNKSSAGRYK